MKVKVLSRDSSLYTAQRSGDLAPIHRNFDANFHPFQKAREYTRALNATKLSRLFAKPFVGQLGNGHIDGVYSLAKDEHNLLNFASGSGDGVIKLWNINERRELVSFQAHNGIVRGLCFSPSRSIEGLLSCASDGEIKLWSADGQLLESFDSNSANYGIDRHYVEAKFANACESVKVWDYSRKSPIQTYKWGPDNYQSVRFNRSETSVLASTGFDNSIVLYDIRTNSPITKIITTQRSNKIVFNPLEPFYFCSASEDQNIYLFDMRNVQQTINVFKDHVAAVIDIDFSPTGQELVSGSYDRTIRIFPLKSGHSKDVYHTKRMQRVFSVLYTMDSRFVISGSDEGNIRMWRSDASRREAILSTRERSRIEYLEALKSKYRHMPEIRRIDRHRHLPSLIKNLASTKRTKLDTSKRREDNMLKQSRDPKKPIPERKKHIVAIKE